MELVLLWRWVRTSIRCSWLTVWCCTDWPLISRISSPTCSVACLWIMPPCMIRATMHRPSSVIFNVMPYISGFREQNYDLRYARFSHWIRTLCARTAATHNAVYNGKTQIRSNSNTNSNCNHTVVFYGRVQRLSLSLTIGSSVFFWNWTNRTRVTCWSSPFSTLSLSSPFM